MSFSTFGYDKYCEEHAVYLNFLAKINDTKQIDEKETCNLVEALIKQESGGNPYAFNPEKTGSYGLMQIQCKTARGLGFLGDCRDLYNPHINLALGIKLIIHLKTRYKTTKDIIAAYNAGRVIVKDGQYINNTYVEEVYLRLKSKRGIVSNTTKSFQD